jgi:hypothetical protein
MNNVRVWEEGGRWGGTLRGRRGGGLDSYLYEAGPGTRQHVDLRSTVCPWEFPVPERRGSVGASHRTRLLDNLVLAVRPLV